MQQFNVGLTGTVKEIIQRFAKSLETLISNNSGDHFPAGDDAQVGMLYYSTKDKKLYVLAELPNGWLEVNKGSGEVDGTLKINTTAENTVLLNGEMAIRSKGDGIFSVYNIKTSKELARINNDGVTIQNKTAVAVPAFSDSGGADFVLMGKTEKSITAKRVDQVTVGKSARADLATNATHANSADTATLADSADKAGTALRANTAAKADTATKADSAEVANTANYASSAGDVAWANVTGKPEVYTKTDSDNKYAVKTDVYTKTEGDLRYAAKTSVHTKNEADGRFAYKTNTESALNTKANKADVYTKLEVMSKLGDKVDKGSVYTKTQADERYQQKGNYLTTESADGKYQLKGDYLTTSTADGKYQPKGRYVTTSNDLELTAQLATAQTQIPNIRFTSPNSVNGYTFDKPLLDYFTKSEINDEFLSKNTSIVSLVNKEFKDNKISADGYQRFPGGFTIQWGYEWLRINEGTNKTIRFPTSFRIRCCHVGMQMLSGVSGRETDQNDWGLDLVEMETTSFTMCIAGYGRHPGSDARVYWFAIGY